MKDTWLLVRKINTGRAGEVFGAYHTFGIAKMVRSRMGKKYYDIVKVTLVEPIDMSKYDKEKQ